MGAADEPHPADAAGTVSATASGDATPVALERCPGCGRQASIWHRAPRVCGGLLPANMSREHAAWVDVAREALRLAREPNVLTLHWTAADREREVSYRRAELTSRLRLDSWEREQAARAPRPTRQIVQRGPARFPSTPKGTKHPRCGCGRALVPGRNHTCKPLRRSHRHPSTDAIVSPVVEAPTALPPPLPFPVEGVVFDCKLTSELNASSWNRWGRRRRTHDQWKRTSDALKPYAPPPGPWIVTIERTGWAAMDLHDNARIAAKAVVDCVASWLGCDDGDTSRVDWLYAQKVTRETETVQTRKGPVRQSVNRVRIVVVTRP